MGLPKRLLSPLRGEWGGDRRVRVRREGGEECWGSETGDRGPQGGLCSEIPLKAAPWATMNPDDAQSHRTGDHRWASGQEMRTTSPKSCRDGPPPWSPSAAPTTFPSQLDMDYTAVRLGNPRDGTGRGGQSGSVRCSVGFSHSPGERLVPDLEEGDLVGPLLVVVGVKNVLGHVVDACVDNARGTPQRPSLGPMLSLREPAEEENAA